MSLHTERGRAALAAAMAEPDPPSLAAATRLRKHFDADLAAEALGQAVLRRKARAKFGEGADELFFTPHGLEQATRPEVADWRARRLVAAGTTRVVDLGCGIGADSMACLRAGIDVTAVELDPTTADHARANLGPGAQVITGDAVALAPELLVGADEHTCVFIDPARRTDAGRTWRVDQFTPPWTFVLDLLTGPHSAVGKLGPGVPREILPEGVGCDFVSHAGDVVEASLWRLPGSPSGHRAVLLPGEHVIASTGEVLPVGPAGAWLHEPDGAVIRARALDAIDPRMRLLDPETAYLTSDEAITSPFLTSFRIIDEMDAGEKTLRAWVRAHDIGTLEIKKRGVDLDPAELRRRLKPKGRVAATLVIGRTPGGARAWHVERV